MEENYYDILEVSTNASTEIIEKAYKTLVKKYHPDLQESNLKNIYEQKIKKINEAYEVLSNPEKRKQYDINIKNKFISIENYNNLVNENINLKKNLNYLKNEINNLKNNNINNNDFYKNNNNNTNYNVEKNNLNNNFYINYNKVPKNIIFKIKFQKILKDFLALFLTIIFFIIIGFILWHIPFTKNYLINLYNENEILKFIIDLFIN